MIDHAALFAAVCRLTSEPVTVALSAGRVTVATITTTPSAVADLADRLGMRARKPFATTLPLTAAQVERLIRLDTELHAPGEGFAAPGDEPDWREAATNYAHAVRAAGHD